MQIQFGSVQISNSTLVVIKVLLWISIIVIYLFFAFFVINKYPGASLRTYTTPIVIENSKRRVKMGATNSTSNTSFSRCLPLFLFFFLRDTRALIKKT